MVMTAEELLERYEKGERDFSGIRLRGAFLNNAELAEINLSGADLNGADFCRTNLTKANLSRINLSGANLINAKLKQVNLSRANLSGANLTDIKILNSNLTQANLNGANISGENWIESCNCDQATFRGACFVMAALSQLSCRSAIFDGAFFGSDSGFSDSDLTGASFKGCDLSFPEYIPPDAGYLILPDGQMVGEKK